MSRVRANLAALSTLRTLHREARQATPEEQRLLARWSGWGAVPEVFDPARSEFAWARTQLADLLDEKERASAARSTLNAHYTDAALVQTMWAAAKNLGFAGGQVLEPGCGSGNFIGFAPPAARVTGVELEPTTAGIAAALYPTAKVIPHSFADARLPEDYFDLVIGNVPFGNFTVHDARHNASGMSIHNYFIARSLRLTRPGGLVMVLTSRFTMDARNPAARREIASLADLVGVLRLPGGAHQRAAGTSVVTDLLVLRRREPGRTPSPAAWEQARPVELDGHQVPVNEYFLANPAAVLGRLGAARGAYRADDLTVTAQEDTLEAFTTALDQLAAHAREHGLTWAPPTGPTHAPALPAGPVEHPDGYLQAHPDGTFTEIADGAPIPFPVPRTQARELRALPSLRDTTAALLHAESTTAEDTPGGQPTSTSVTDASSARAISRCAAMSSAESHGSDKRGPPAGWRKLPNDTEGDPASPGFARYCRQHPCLWQRGCAEHETEIQPYSHSEAF